MLLAMDPPRHVDYRRPIAPRFKARVIAADGRPDPRDLPRDHGRGRGRQGDVEFVHDVTSTLPSRVIGQLMGLPDDDLPMIHRLAEMNTSGQDADYADRRRRRARSTWRCTRSSSRPQRRQEAAAGGPHDAAARDRLQRPLHDRHRLRQLLRAARHRGQRHDEDDAVVGAARAARAPRPARRRCAPIPSLDRRARSRRSCATTTRCTTSAAPRPPTRCCATSTIKAGDKVAMIYTSANRDEDVFDDPQRFDIRRIAEPAPVVRDRRALLPRRAPRPARRPGVLRGAARDVPDDRAHGRARARPLEPQQRAEGRCPVRLDQRLSSLDARRRVSELGVGFDRRLRDRLAAT